MIIWLYSYMIPSFNPRSPCGERRRTRFTRPPVSGFNPRSPCGERPSKRLIPCARYVVSTHAPLAGSDVSDYRQALSTICVSTHAPLAGSDLPCSRCSRTGACFNPRSPCGERPTPVGHGTTTTKFQPTLPLRGATQGGHVGAHQLGVSTHAPLAGSDYAGVVLPPTIIVSTHAPLAGSDGFGGSVGCRNRVSTHAPLAGSDGPCCARGVAGHGVSTHAPLAGSDTHREGALPCQVTFQPTLPLRGATRQELPQRRGRACFNPRSPCGERLPAAWAFAATFLFQPTLPLRGATSASPPVGMAIQFQPTLPLRGATEAILSYRAVRICFNPRSPCGERHLSYSPPGRHIAVSTHAPLAGSDGR